MDKTIIMFKHGKSYEQLKKELDLHAGKCKRWLIMHDTTTFGDHDQSMEGGHGDGRGLWPAITEFILDHKEWKLLERHTDCNGLTILEKQK